MVAICVSQSGSLFSAIAWRDVTFIAAEVRDPHRNLPRAMAIGCGAVTGLYVLANVAYLAVLPLSGIQHAPSDRVATAVLERIFPGYGPVLMAVAIMISTFGCTNGLVLAGARAYYAMAKDGLFFARAGELNRARVPGWSLAVQGIWAVGAGAAADVQSGHRPVREPVQQPARLRDFRGADFLHFDDRGGVPAAHHAARDAERPYRVIGYPLLPAAYILAASVILVVLFAYRPATTWPGLVIVAAGAAVYAVFGHRARAVIAGPCVDHAINGPNAVLVNRREARDWRGWRLQWVRVVYRPCRGADPRWCSRRSRRRGRARRKRRSRYRSTARA